MMISNWAIFISPLNAQSVVIMITALVGIVIVVSIIDSDDFITRTRLMICNASVITLKFSHASAESKLKSEE